MWEWSVTLFQMAPRSRHGLLAAVCLLILLAATPAAAVAGHGETDSSVTQSDTLVVDSHGNGDYRSVQAAIDAADDGDTIRVRAGEYSGFRISKDVRIIAADALVTGPVQIVGDAAPVIEGLTVRSTTPDSFGIAAAETSGDWTLRDVTVESVSDEIRPVFVRESTGDWRIENALIEDRIDASESRGDWTITQTAVSSVEAYDSTGDWKISETIIDHRQSQYDYTPLDATNTSGSWRLEHSAVLANTSQYGVSAVGAGASSGSWTIRGSYVTEEISAASSTGDWRITRSYVGPSNASAENTAPSVQIGSTSGAWRIFESTIHGALGVNTEVQSVNGEPVDAEYTGRGEATRIYWGQPGGPWNNTDESSYGTFAEQCPGGIVFPEVVTCTNPLDSPPQEVPDASIVADIGPDRSFVVDADAGPYEEIQPAIEAAPPGATIRVRAGEYDGFRVAKSVQIVTEGAAIDGNVRIAGDAAPVIEGFTIRNGRVNARETSGDWILRDVTANSTAPDALGAADATKVDALDSTGNWRVVDSEVTQIQAQRTEGDWTVANTTVAIDLKAVESSGEWVLRASVIGTVGDDTTLRLPAWESSGDWLVQDSAVIGTNATSIATRDSTGAWQLRGSYLSGELSAGETTGVWTVRNS